jgi:hypothetical protein
MKPQEPVIKIMKENNVWDEMMENLPDNPEVTYWKNKETK